MVIPYPMAGGLSAAFSKSCLSLRQDNGKAGGLLPAMVRLARETLSR
jgi:hypothetical protein